MDDTYQIYVNRVARLTFPATYQSQLQHIQESPKFKPLPDGSREAVPFPGYTVISPPWADESENWEFYTNLQELQQQLLAELDSGLMVPLPTDSFHLTLADLIWNNAYRDAEIENPNFEQELQEKIVDSFEKYQESFPIKNPIGWQLLGIMIMPRAIGVCLVPKDEDSYQRILHLRRAIYQNSSLIGLGIEQQYHLTAHVTLGYFGEIPENLDRDRITNLLCDFNQMLLEKEGTSFSVRQAELRKFDDMMRYYREPDWPVLKF